MYRIRYDIVDSDLDADSLIQACQTTSHVLVRHELPHGNPHYHVYIATELKENTLRQRIKRLNPEMKSSDYSIKKCNPSMINEYVQYLFNTKHGNVWELIDTHNFDNDLINSLIENAKKISEDYELVKSKPNHRITIWDMAEQVNDLVVEKWIAMGNGRKEDFPLDSDHEQQIISDYTDMAIFVLRKHRKPFDEYLLRKVLATSMSNHEFMKDILRKKMINNYCRLY